MDADERALMAAIIADPEEDTPRLVYADWCDENGRPERAEYIRLSIELANLRYGAPDFSDRGRLLRERLRPFEQLANDIWPRELKARLSREPDRGRRDVHFLFSRGFASQVRCSVGYFLGNADALLREVPGPTFVPLTLDAAKARRLVNSKPFRRLKAIGLWRPQNALALLECELVDITALDFSQSGDETSGWMDVVAETVAVHPGLAAVRRLNFENCGLGSLAGACLADARHLEPDVLNLLGHDLEDRVKQALRVRYGPRVWLDEIDRAGTRRGDPF